MLATHPPDVNDRFSRSFIRRAAKELISDGVYPRGDLEDVIQELTLCLIERLPKFDPGRARWTTFVKTVVSNKAISMRRHQSAGCRRDQQDVASLDVMIKDQDDRLVAMGGTISEEEFRSGQCVEHRDATQHVETRQDVAAVLAGLPDDVRETCELLKSHSVAAVARRLGVPRSSLINRLQRLRAHFEAAGLRDCL